MSGRSVLGSERWFEVTEEQQRLLADRLKGGSGGGTSDGMQERVTRLEKNVDQLSKDVSDLRVDVSAIKENLRHLPTKPWMFTTLLGMLTAIGGLMAVLIRFLPHA